MTIPVLREATEGKLTCCLFCKFFDTDSNKCLEGADVTDYRTQVCDSWRYVA